MHKEYEIFGTGVVSALVGLFVLLNAMEAGGCIPAQATDRAVTAPAVLYLERSFDGFPCVGDRGEVLMHFISGEDGSCCPPRFSPAGTREQAVVCVGF